MICGETFLRISNRFIQPLFPAPVAIAVTSIIVLLAFGYSFRWHFKSRKGQINDSINTSFWVGAIRYGIAFDMTMFGFQKFFHLQFTTPMAMLDEPFSSLSSQWLTWSYFGHSYPYVCAIAISQIVTSILLLFNRTRLLGCISMVPVLLNIILIDYFYELDLGVLIHAIVLFAGIIYLLMLDRERLVTFFFAENNNSSGVITKPLLKNLLRISIVVVPVGLIFANESPDKHPELSGKYFPSTIVVNNEPRHIESCKDSLLTYAYFDIGNECVLEFNGLNRRMFGKYEWDGDSIRINWHYPENAKSRGLKGRLKISDNNVELTGTIGKDTLTFNLQRVAL
jgi:hypothetical protein